jgi:hypothetical protein
MEEIGFGKAAVNENTETIDLISDFFKCEQCGALYSSEHALDEHHKAAHHADICDRQLKISY